MGEVHSLPSPADTEREASDWFARMSADDVTADDHVRFEAWLRARACNEKAYAELTATWKELVKAGPLVRAVHFGQVMNAASASGRSVRSRRWLAGAVAATIGAVALGVVWNLYRQKEETRFQTAIGEQAAVALPDGSSFDLNTNSRVEIDYSQRTRVIRLERGEAYFKVAHDTHRPFWVHAGDRWVRADESPPADAAYAKSAASVTAGEQADAHGRADVIHSLDTTQLSRLLAWRKSSLYFQDEPLGDVVNELMRYTTLRIDIADDSLRQLPVGGTFQTSPEGAEALLRMLQDGFGTRIHRVDADHVSIEGPAE
jgi:transmembrane sensor